jgi:hypothetical protein
MTTCANCVSDAKYDYIGITYCEKHLPRFLRDRNGFPGKHVTILEVNVHGTPFVFVPPAPPVEFFIVEETVEEPVEVVKETPKPQPKKKAATKAN